MKTLIVSLFLVGFALNVNAMDVATCEATIKGAMANQNLDLKFRGYYACSERAQKANENAYKAKNVFSYAWSSMVASAAGDSRNTTLAEEVKNVCAYVVKEVKAIEGQLATCLAVSHAIAQAKSTIVGIVSKAQDCYIDGWPADATAALSDVAAEAYTNTVLESSNNCAP